ncbi:uncharacterized protein LOC134247538 [Saccostrea cucullata]|uniref:uncharacterized protein LOC134247538 n=1 Tax=Saccostrea cuccullata TaxID=36930 RepID=UPI002ED3482A
MDHIPRLSEILYFGLCAKIGTPTEVTIRRDLMDMDDMIKENIHTGKHKCRGRLMLSGSRREGFRFKTSDWDYMLWTCDRYFLINDISQLRDYVPSNLDIVLMDDTDTPPGFVRLQLLTRPRYACFSLVPLNDRVYISSLFWRQLALKNSSRSIKFQNVHEHGPCCSGYLDESTEVDTALCFACKYWPRGTNHWTERCLRHKWPPASVLKDILNDNYHCVAIGSKSSPIAYTLDWRLSFSLAEQKLVFTMNHTQFICYGLLKIFLKDVINKNVEEPLLCSYFMKTTMFWLIQVGHMNWSPNNLLECFWMCFKYLVQSVNSGKFANFFIPQNNMFMNKVIGIARESLLDQLNQYYRMGLPCLLLSPTLKSILEPALSRPCSIQFTGNVCFEIGCACQDLCAVDNLKEIFVNKYFFIFKICGHIVKFVTVTIQILNITVVYS